MRIISESTLREFWQRHPDAEPALRRWLRRTREADWQSILDIRQLFPHADAVDVASGATVTIFNIKGNEYRLIVAIHFNTKRIFVREFLTHAEYDKDDWKDRN